MTTSEAPTSAHEYTYRRLDDIAALWTKPDEVPSTAMALSTGEYTALVRSIGYEGTLRGSALVGFILLDGWLQRNVLQRRGLGQLIGTRIGA